MDSAKKQYRLQAELSKLGHTNAMTKHHVYTYWRDIAIYTTKEEAYRILEHCLPREKFRIIEEDY